MPHDPSPDTLPLATLLLDRNMLRDALVEALRDARVIRQIVEALGSGAQPAGGVSRFMNTKEYASHARISVRSLDYLRRGMTEGVHFSRTGRRVRYHVAEADDFIAQVKRPSPGTQQHADLGELVRREAAKRRPKARPPEGPK